MSVCFFVPADQAGTSTAEESIDQEGPAEDSADTQHQNLQQFWAKVTDDIRKVTAEDFKTQALPLARIKKIMKLDEEVKMISAEAPVLFAKAAEIFIHELTMRAWNHTEDNKRRTLQRNDIAMAISKSDQFDFLIDIVPRHDVKPSKPRDEPRHTTEHFEICMEPNIQQCGDIAPPYELYAEAKLSKLWGNFTPKIKCPVVHQQQSLPTSNQQQFVIQPCAQVVQQQSASTSVVPQPVTLVQQVVTPQGEVQQLPLQLTQAQLNMIRLQVQNNPTQPIIIQAQPHNSQIIQVSSQAQHQPQQQVFLAQVASQEDS